MDAPNPYEPPSTRPGADRPRFAFPARRRRVGAVAVFLLNLSLPLAVGLPMGDAGARIGMMAAAGILGVSWVASCARCPRLALVLIPGGLAVALSQVVPILHLLAGDVARIIGIAAGCVDESPDPLGIEMGFKDRVLGPAGGLLVGSVMGLLLMLAASVLGLLFRLRNPGRPRPDAPRPEREHPGP
ncbi:hypothetical protein [Tautonia plasticadhaerens]|uniref:hypothetical protein n=1 Tax=Tautonia plasticadhaerens TaxID=2527974 RepID=UPI0011A585A2|nr:hypothetical protein [Tautonia plasticadhaerens]